MKRQAILLALALAWAGAGMAQDYTMVVHLDDGTLQAYDVAHVDSVRFADAFINGHEAVDLGLSVKWATMNVGASSPTDYGGYYAWGETETKETYSASNCVTYGVEMSDISGNAEYDAATANWGSSWRMPTQAEQEELIYNCTWERTLLDGVDGYLVKGGAGSIFLPAAGRYDGDSLTQVGYNGYYWSSTPTTGRFYSSIAYYLNCISACEESSTGEASVNSFYGSRYYGCPIRPVSD